MKRAVVVFALAAMGLGCKGEKGDTGAPGAQGVQGPAGPMPSVATNAGIVGTGTTADPIAVNFGGTGTATTVARSDHAHLAGSFGKLTVFHGTVDTVTLPWSAAQATALLGSELFWSAAGPNFRDIGACNPAYRIDNTSDTQWPGNYTVQFVQCLSGTCIQGSWLGWELRLSNASDTVIAGPAFSRVDFTLSFEGGAWRIQHMAGLVGTTPFECH